MTPLGRLALFSVCLASLPSPSVAQTGGAALPAETDSAARRELTIRLAGEPRWRRARNETTVVLGGDVRVQASYLVVDAAGTPRPGVSLVVYARGDGPLARAAAVSDNRGVAKGDMFFLIDPGLTVALQACLQGDPGVCSPQRTLNLRQRVVLSTDVTAAYSLAPNLPPPSPNGVSFCERVRDCTPILRLYSATAGNQVEVAAVTTATLTMRETSRRGQRTNWSFFGTFPLLVQSTWASTYFGNRSAGTAIAPGDFSFGTGFSGKFGYIRGAFDGRTPRVITAIDQFVDESSGGSVNSYADGFNSVDIAGQVNATVGSTGLFYARAVVSTPFARHFERAFINGRPVADVVGRRGVHGQASAGFGLTPRGQAFALSPWVGVSVEDATRLVSNASRTIASPASTDLLAGVQYADLRGGPLATTLGTTVSGLAGGQLVVSFFISVNARELFVIR